MEKTTYIPEKIAVCPACKATGVEPVFLIGNRYEANDLEGKCQLCNGSGRVRISGRTVIVTKPYVIPEYHQPILEQ